MVTAIVINHGIPYHSGVRQLPLSSSIVADAYALLAVSGKRGRNTEFTVAGTDIIQEVKDKSAVGQQQSAAILMVALQQEDHTIAVWSDVRARPYVQPPVRGICQRSS